MIRKSHDSLMRAELVTARFWQLIEIRLPWLIVGLAGGLFASIIVSKFELSLREYISLAFFIPIVTNMADGIGTQTETIFIRALANLKFDIFKYILRELGVGAVIGSVMGILSAIFAYFLSGSQNVAMVVGTSLFLAMSLATTVACLTPLVLKTFKQDPAVGTGPFTTALQDVFSLLIYFFVAWLML